MQITRLRNISRIAYLSIVLLMSTLFSGCTIPPKTDKGITFLAPRGYPFAQSIAWSPVDANKILVVSDAGMGRPGLVEVDILDVKTGHRDEVVKTEGNIFQAVWAPNGKSILMLVGEVTKGFDPQGWWQVNLEDKSVKFLSNYLGVAWAPDGKTLAAFTGEAQKGRTGMGNIKLQLIDVDANSTETVYEPPSSGFVSNPVWSPDGKFMAFLYGEDLSAEDLYVLNVQTREAVKITENQPYENPAWSPNGNIIAVERVGSGKFLFSIHLISSDGKCDIEVPVADDISSPTWSPNGRKLGYIDMENIYFLDVNQVMGRDIYQGLCP